MVVALIFAKIDSMIHRALRFGALPAMRALLA